MARAACAQLTRVRSRCWPDQLIRRPNRRPIWNTVTANAATGAISIENTVSTSAPKAKRPAPP